MAATLPPEAIALASRMYDAARNGQLDIFQQALPAGLPANMTNDKGDSLVSHYFCSHSFLWHSTLCPIAPSHVILRASINGTQDPESSTWLPFPCSLLAFNLLFSD
jgi:hypothetical protein